MFLKWHIYYNFFQIFFIENPWDPFVSTTTYIFWNTAWPACTMQRSISKTILGIDINPYPIFFWLSKNILKILQGVPTSFMISFSQNLSRKQAKHFYRCSLVQEHRWRNKMMVSRFTTIDAVDALSDDKKKSLANVRIQWLLALSQSISF